jgi:hypothetical protein
MGTLTVNDLLEGRVGLDIECMDRIYLNGYVPSLQVGGQVAGFMTRHLGYPLPSPAIMDRIGTSFRRAVNSFAEDNHILNRPGFSAGSVVPTANAARGCACDGSAPLRTRLGSCSPARNEAWCG